MKQEQIFGIALVSGAGILLYLLNKKGLLHESVSSRIVPSQEGTGYPQFDSRDPSTIPSSISNSVYPLDNQGNATPNPKDPTKASCPSGFLLWHDIADDSYVCLG